MRAADHPHDDLTTAERERVTQWAAEIGIRALARELRIDRGAVRHVIRRQPIARSTVLVFRRALAERGRRLELARAVLAVEQGPAKVAAEALRRACGHVEEVAP